MTISRSKKPKALDLFCGAGGASMGLHLAGYNVTGVDIKDQPNYPFRFKQGDALKTDIRGYDLIWASPPCQRYSQSFVRDRGKYPDLIADVRRKLRGRKHVIENVPFAPLDRPIMLCGSMFGLNVIRHRHFESSHELVQPAHRRHTGKEIPVYGMGTSEWHRVKFGRNILFGEKCEAMGIKWMNLTELNQAIPPMFAHYIGTQLL